jgi:hypothetical protein
MVGYEMHEYWKKLLKMDFAKSKADMNFPSVAAFIIRFKKLLSASKSELKLPDKAYIILFINAFQSSYDSWAEQWLKLARPYNSTVTLDKLYVSSMHLDES